MTDAEAIAILRERQRQDVRPGGRRHVRPRLSRHRGRRRRRARAPRGACSGSTQSRHDARRGARAGASKCRRTRAGSLLAFVSLSRVASGDAGVADVLALGSRLLADIVPGATGAWFVPDPARDRLVVADAFGPAATRCAASSVGDRRAADRVGRRQPAVDPQLAGEPGSRRARRAGRSAARHLHQRTARRRRHRRRGAEHLRLRGRRGVGSTSGACSRWSRRISRPRSMLQRQEPP